MADPILGDISAALSSTPAPAPAAVASSPTPSHTDPVLGDVHAALTGKLPPQPESKPSPGILATGLAGMNTGLIANTLGDIAGLPTEVVNAVLQRHGAAGLTKPFENPLPPEWWNQQLGKFGIGTSAVPAQTEGEKIAQAAGVGAGQMLGMALPARAAVGAAEAAGPVIGGVTKAMGERLPLQAAMGVTGGAGGEVGKEIAPPGYENLGQTVGSLAGGMVPAGAEAAIGIGKMAASAVPPLTTASREAAAKTAATQMLAASSLDPQAAFQRMQERIDADHAEIPGVKETTAESAGDSGMAALQRTRSRQNEELGAAVTDQNIANLEKEREFVEGMAPQGTNAEPAQAAVKQHLNNIDTWGQIDLENARAAVAGGHAGTEAALSAADTASREQLEKATGAFGGQEALGTPAEQAAGNLAIGAGMQDPGQAAYVAERKRLSDLQKTIDPSGTMGIRPDPIKAAVDEIKNTFTKESGASYSGAENNLYNTAKSWGDIIPFDQATQFRANINGRLRQVPDHSPQEMKRLMMLKSGVDQAISDAVGDTHVAEQAGTVNQGVPPIETRISGLAENPEVGPSFAQDVARAYAANPAALRAARGDPTGRSILETAERARGSIPEGTVPAEGGEGSDTNGGLRGGPGSEGVPQEPGEAPPAVVTPLTEEARQLHRQWTAEYRQMMQTFQGETAGKLHAFGKMIQKGGVDDEFRLAPGQVPSFFADAKGEKGRLAVRSFLDAAPPEAHEQLDNAFGFSLRQAAQDPVTGELDLNKYEKWKNPRLAALSERPELLEKFGTAAKAQQQLNQVRDDLAEFQKTYADALKTAEKGATNDLLNARNAYENEVARKFITADPEHAVRMLFTNASDRIQQARALMNLVSGNKAATEGLQRAAIDHIMDTYATGVPISGSSMGTFKAQELQKFIRNNHGVLDVLFPNGLSQNFDALAAVLKRQQMVPNAKLSGGSDTMQLQNAAKQHETPHGNGMSQVGMAVAAEEIGKEIFKIPGLALAVPIVGGMLKHNAELLRLSTNNTLDAMLMDPQYALDMRAAYGPKMAGSGRPSVISRYATRLMQNAIMAARARDLTGGAQPAAQRASGGRLDHRNLSVADQGRHFADLLEAARKRHYANGGSVRAMSVEEQGAHLADMIEKRRKEISAQDVASVPAS